MKKKVKICMNAECINRVNKPDAAVCAGCGSSFRGMSWQFLSDEEIERLLSPDEKVEEATRETDESGEEQSAREEQEQSGGMFIICPSCQRHIPYRVGLEFCECGEYVQEEIPVQENTQSVEEGQQETAEERKVTALQSLDGLYRLELTGEWMKVGRKATGEAYFESNGKYKVCREHAILQLTEGEWYISYCKREDRNYIGGVENPIFINKRKMERQESYKLKPGDEIAFAESDPSDSMAAFFRVE